MENKVYILKKAFSGLKQDPQASNTRVDEYFQKNGFVKSLYEHELYTKTNLEGDITIVCLYVDAMIFIGNNHGMFNDFKKVMTNIFKMTYIEFLWNKKKICKADFKKVQNERMQASEYASKNKHKAKNWD